MVKFKVKVESGTGREEIDAESPGYSIYEFDTEAERQAFIRGVDLAYNVMEGWVDAFCCAEEIE